MARLARQHRVDRLRAVEQWAPPPPGPTVGDLLDAIPDPDERQRLTTALVELVALDQRRTTLTTAEQVRAADLAMLLHLRLLPKV